jgi:hypothetical protein
MTLEQICAELRRQAEENTAFAPYADIDDPKDAVLDGHFDLTRLADDAEIKALKQRNADLCDALALTDDRVKALEFRIVDLEERVEYWRHKND